MVPPSAGTSMLSELQLVVVGCRYRRGRRCPTQAVVGRELEEVGNAACGEATGVDEREPAARTHIGHGAAVAAAWPLFFCTSLEAVLWSSQAL